MKGSPIGKRTSLLRLGKKCFIAFVEDKKVFRLILEKIRLKLIKNIASAAANVIKHFTDVNYEIL